MFYFPFTRKLDYGNLERIDYDEYWKKRGFEINKKLKEREVIMLEHIPAGSRVLNAGGGNSRLSLDLAEKGCEVVVGDISPIVLEEFRKRGVPTMSLDLEDSSSLINMKSQFDYIILSEVLEHMKYPEEVVRALAPHTRYLFLTVPNSAFYRYRIHLLVFGRFFTQWAHYPSEHLRFWSYSDFKDWLKALKLELVKTYPSNGFSLPGMPLYKWFPNLFCHQPCYLVKGKR